MLVQPSIQPQQNMTTLSLNIFELSHTWMLDVKCRTVITAGNQLDVFEAFLAACSLQCPESIALEQVSTFGLFHDLSACSRAMQACSHHMPINKG